MLNLVINEWNKVFIRKSNYVTLFIILGTSALLSLMPLLFNDESAFEDISYGKDWQDQAANQITTLEEENTKLLTSESKVSFVNEITASDNQDEIERLNYHLKEGIKPPANNNLYKSLVDTSDLNLLVGIFVTIIASAMVSKEFSMGTIKLLLIRSYSRSKILTSKYIATLLITVTYYMSLYIGTIVVALFTSEINSTTEYVYLSSDWTYMHSNFWFYFLGILASNLIYLIIIATIAFSLSTISRNTSLSLGTTLGILFLGPLLTLYLSSKTELAKYLLMANWNLTNYLPGNNPSIEGMTFTFSMIINSLYLFLLLFAAYYSFNKKDILA
ncbi:MULTISPECIES: ABC transporter permease [Carnobacterium]|uniref:ABC transporter n=2 Tax=Carnobacterium inhibens TaxID=147709 RepID=U5S927_9LACT|nr:ABC transporter permease [Carnobacterium inhibens]AGY81730.1 ABC transporter [Carnobacterium inhibens subsp. gilichinskyi]MBC9824885.1 ABC transporter permease subunit [Carnobacterium inhibens]MCM3512486.1 ABC transporter permease [Carnobacterium inhibens]